MQVPSLRIGCKGGGGAGLERPDQNIERNCPCFRCLGLCMNGVVVVDAFIDDDDINIFDDIF